MADIVFEYQVDGSDYHRAGEASRSTKSNLKKLGFPSDIIRRVGICMYEGEINMVIHADGGVAKVVIGLEDITIILKDKGPGIPNIDLAMQEGWSTADSQANDLGFGAGMGLPNMKRCSDEMNIDTVVGEGTTVTMKIKTK